MCGIAGIFDLRGRNEVDRGLLRRMTDILHHRGPDGDGFYYAPGIGLGHRRLAIVDLATGDQPLFNEDGSVCVVYNGEIYNFQSLMPELTALGHVFRTRCDTEVIVHAWEEWGEACLDRFNGQFAFALWDARDETLFLARDRFGEKPLSYSLLNDGRLLFASELKSLLLRLRVSVRMRMIADVPLGAFLSGGVDSSGVVALMAGLKPDPVSTFSIAFGTKGWDESRYATAIAARYHTEHHVKEVDPNSFDLLERLATIYDEPFSDSSAMPTFRVCAMARENVTVALSGDGGDEVFAGYRRYRWHCFEERVRRVAPEALRHPLFATLGALYPKLDWAPRPFRARTTLEDLARDTVEAYFSSVSVCGTRLRRRLFSSELARELQGYDAVEVLRSHMRRCASDDPLSQAQYADFKTYLPGDILTKVDRASMANSLKVRVPLLDHIFVEWAAALPPQLKLRGREGKYVFKSALEPYVPNEILYRPKQGFAVPIATWFRGPLRRRVRDTLCGPVLRHSGLFDMETIANLLDQHQSGERDHSAALWTLSMMEAFLRQVHNGGVQPQPTSEIAESVA